MNAAAVKNDATRARTMQLGSVARNPDECARQLLAACLIPDTNGCDGKQSDAMRSRYTYNGKPNLVEATSIKIQPQFPVSSSSCGFHPSSIPPTLPLPSRRGPSLNAA